MKILLAACNAKYIHSNPAVYDLRAFASEYKEHILLGEYTINQTKDEILKEIYRSGAEVVCFSCYIWNISFVRELIFDLKKILPGTAFWVGGPEVSFDAENFLKEMPQVTGVMVGEGEETFLELVKKELQFFLDKKVPQVKFVDRTFNCKHDHAMEIWKYILEHDNGVTNFHFEISADLLREEELELMSRMRPGLIQLEIGVQSTNPDTIRAIHRNMDLKKLEASVARVKSFGNIHQHLDLIAGLPCEDYESFRRSFEQVYRMKPDQLQLGFLKVLKGSSMYHEAQKYEILYKEKEPYEVLSTAWLSYEDILKLKMVESMVEVYYNSGQFRKTLSWIETFYQEMFSFYESLGAYYEEKGYEEISHSRLRRYEILLEFLKEKTQLPVNTASQHMVYDLYLREKLKKRPVFAMDQKPYEASVRNYRKANKIPKTAHIEVFGDGSAVLFDYEARDPLTNNARAEQIFLERNPVNDIETEA